MDSACHYLVGLDLGQVTDYSALAILERTEHPDPEHAGQLVRHYAVRLLRRFPLGTPYPDLCAEVAKLFARLLLRGSILVVDHTGVGRPVLDILRKVRVQARLWPVTITGGSQVTRDKVGGWGVPKKDLVSALQVLLQSRWLKIAPSLPEAKTLVRELTHFQMKITPAAHETFGCWRDGVHDDLVLAVALPCWCSERALRKMSVGV
jgi:hypothetical protein